MNYKYTDKELIKAVKTSFSIAQVLRKLNIKACGGNYKTFYNKVKKINLDISHFTGQGHLKGKTHNWNKKMDLKKALVRNSPYRTSYHLKNRLLKENLLRNNCSICGINTWQNKPLSLHLDHINGINNDNRIENLRLLCPNCHSQTDTYCAKNKKILSPSD